MVSTFIMFKRTKDALVIIKDPKAFALLAFIALRAKRTDSLSIANLKQGQALIGDLEHLGQTEGEYRAAKKRLESFGLATFKGTPKGTVATLNDDRIFDINLEGRNDQRNGQPADEQRTGNGRAATNKNINNINKITRRNPDFAITTKVEDESSSTIAELWANLSEDERVTYVKAGLTRWPFLPPHHAQIPLSEFATLIGFTEFSKQFREKRQAGKGEQ